MRGESFASPIPSGAGRVRDLFVPDTTVVGAGTYSGAIRARATGDVFFGAGMQNLGNLISSGNLFYQGVNCTTMNNVGAAGVGGCLSLLNAMNVMVRTTRPAFWPLDDDYNVHRIVWIAAGFPPLADTADYGLQLINSNVAAAGIIRTPALGFGFQWTVAGLAFIANNGGGPVLTPLLTDGVGGFVRNDWHSLEFRILQAMPTQDALLKIIVDDVLLSTISWAGGTLPVPVGPAVGFFPSLWMNAANQALVTHFLGVQSAPSELMVL